MATVNETWGEKLRWARSEVLTLREKYPNESLLLSVLAQLDYLIALDDGVESDDSSLEDIDIGHLAVYQLADMLRHDVSVALCDIAQKVKRDLRRQGRKSKLD